MAIERRYDVENKIKKTGGERNMKKKMKKYEESGVINVSMYEIVKIEERNEEMKSRKKKRK